MERWSGRVAVVTGAGSGIGEAIARLLAKNGMKVVAVDLHLSRVQALAKDMETHHCEVRAIQCDVTKEEDIVRVVNWTREHFGGTDVLVNCAGVWFSMNFTDFPTDKFSTMLNVNILGLSLFTRQVVQDMQSRGVDDGHIFHLCSAAGHRVPDAPPLHIYSASKHAVKVLAEGLRRELRDRKSHIKITNISPGMVKSRIVESSMTPEEAQKFYDVTPCLMPRDIAEAVLYSLRTPPHVQVHDIILQAIGSP